MRLAILSLFTLVALLSSSSQAQITVNHSLGFDDYFELNLKEYDERIYLPVGAGTNVTVSTRPVFGRWAEPYLIISNYTPAHAITTGNYTNAWDIVMNGTNFISGTYALSGYTSYGFLSDSVVEEELSSPSTLITNRSIVELKSPMRNRSYSEAYARQPQYISQWGAYEYKFSGFGETLDLDYTKLTDKTLDYYTSFDGFKISAGTQELVANDDWHIRVIGLDTNSLRYRLTGFNPAGTVYMNLFYNQTFANSVFYANLALLYPEQTNSIANAFSPVLDSPLDMNVLVYDNDLEDTLATEILFTNGAPYVLYNGAEQYSSNIVVLDSWHGSNQWLVVTVPAGAMERDAFAWIDIAGRSESISPAQSNEYWATPVCTSSIGGYRTMSWNPWKFRIPCSTNEFTIKISTLGYSTEGLVRGRHALTGIKLYNIDARRHIFSTLDQDSGHTNYVRNTNCWLTGVDLTPFSPWNSQGSSGDDGGRKAGALVTPQHMVNAWHFKIGLGHTVRFITQDNKIITRTLTKVAQISRKDNDFGYADRDEDLALYEFDSPVPASISYCYVMPTNWPSYLKSASGFQAALIPMDNTIESVTIGVSGHHPTTALGHWQDSSWYTNYVPDILSDHSFNQLVRGDSASPMFFSINGDPVLMSVATGTTAGPNISTLQKEINAQLKAWGSEYRLTEFDLSTLTE